MTITPEELKEDGPGTIVSKLNGPGGGVSFGDPVAIGTTNQSGTSVNVPHADHIHAHGDLAGGSLHAESIAGGAAGFMSGADKTKLDSYAVVGADGTILQASGGTTSFVTVESVLGGQGFVAPIDTLLNLAALAAAGLPDGTEIYVNEVEDIYVLEKAGTHAADGVTVIAATGGGYWVARMNGRWDDMQGSIGQGGGASALTIEAFRDTPFLMWFMRHDQNDALNFVYQFSHSWDYATAVVPHLHVLPMADPAVAQVARFDGYYVWTRPNYAAAPLPALTGWTAFGPIDVTINPGDIYVQKIVSLGSVTPPDWVRESSSLLVWFRRAGTDPGDTYTTSKTGGTQAANLGILSTDVHYRKNKIGSEAQIPT